MDDSELLRISFFVSTAGLLVLFFVSGQLQPSHVPISEISLVHEGKNVETAGTIASIKFHEEGHIFLKVTDGSGHVQVVLFEEVAREVDSSCLEEGKRIEVVGRVEEYRGKPEIVISSAGDLRCWT
jgi:DNA/RNA endonuclease YhcR with UshA esterase domain